MARRNNQIVPSDIIPRSFSREITFEEALKTFLIDAKIRNLSVYTVSYYQTQLSIFRDILDQVGIDTAPDKITLDNIKEHIIVKAKDEGRSATSINTMLRAVRAFFNFLHNEGYINVNPVDGLRMLREQRKIVDTFSKEQLQILLGQPDLRTFTGQRDLTIMLVFLDTGVRVRELCDIDLDDIDWKGGLITIDGKGGKQRQVPFQATTKRQLDKYTRIRGNLVETDALFVTIDNTPITIRQVQDRIKKYGKQAGIRGVRCSPHTFRHTFAKMALLNGANIFALQKILGHTTLEMVRRYVNMFTSEVAEQHRKFSPVEKIY